MNRGRKKYELSNVNTDIPYRSWIRRDNNTMSYLKAISFSQNVVVLADSVGTAKDAMSFAISPSPAATKSWCADNSPCDSDSTTAPMCKNGKNGLIFSGIKVSSLSCSVSGNTTGGGASENKVLLWRNVEWHVRLVPQILSWYLYGIHFHLALK